MFVNAFLEVQNVVIKVFLRLWILSSIPSISNPPWRIDD